MIRFIVTIFLVGRAMGLDYGDLPDDGMGGQYPTLNASDGPRHTISNDLYIGSEPAEDDPDGQPNATATGDAFGEDASEFLVKRSPIDAGFIRTEVELSVVNLTGGPVEVVAFIDVDGDGEFESGLTQRISNIPSGDPSFPPSGITHLPLTYFLSEFFYPGTDDLMVPIRIRISSQVGLGATGAAPDGEVEDHILNFGNPDNPPSVFPMDFGDFPDAGSGTSAGVFINGTVPDYETLSANGGPRHMIVDGLSLGFGVASIDGEPDGQISDDAEGDGGDENGITGQFFNFGFSRVGPETYRFTGMLSVSVLSNNTTGNDAFLSGWADLDLDGGFESGEFLTGSGMVIAGNSQITNLQIPVSFDVTGQCELVNYPLIIPLRLRLSTTENLGPYHGAMDPVPDGEVEDHLVFQSLNVPNFCPDYGDFPDAAEGTAAGDFNGGTLPDYRTKEEDGGPSHFITPGLAFNEVSDPNGNPDGDINGQSNATATGDDTGGWNDESGLLTVVTSFTITPLTPVPVSVQVDVEVMASLPIENTTGNDAYVNAWVDTNLDGDFEFTEEINLGTAALIPGDGSQTSIVLTIPYSFVVSEVCVIDGDYYLPLRVRLSTLENLGPYFAAPNGEVEDHLIKVHLTSSDFCPDVGGQFPDLTGLLKPATGSGLVGAPLQLRSGDFLPPNYSGNDTPVWFLDRMSLGMEPELTPAQLAAVNSGMSILWFQRPNGEAGIAPDLEIIESMSMLDALTGQGLMGADLAPYLDPDGDSWPSFAEYALGSNAGSEGSQPKVFTRIEVDSATNQDHLGLLYLRRVEAMPGVTYLVEGSNDLQAWTEAITPATSVPVGLPSPPTGYQWTFERMVAPETGEDTSFLRMSVE